MNLLQVAAAVDAAVCEGLWANYENYVEEQISGVCL